MLQEPLILTLELDPASQKFFDMQRKRYFPAERNYLQAHLTLFHQIPQHMDSVSYLSGLKLSPFKMLVTGLMKLGGGVAYRVDSPEIIQLHSKIKEHFRDVIIKQDLQPFRPHITIQNKVNPQEALALYSELDRDFKSFEIEATGLHVWTYLGGPWRHECTYSFKG